MGLYFKRISLLCILTFTFYFADAQNKLTGKIIDAKTGEAVAGATVYIPELKTGDIADKNGIYKIDKLPRTIITVQVSFLGYKSVVEKVDLSAIATRDFKLEQAITEMNEVVVTGTSRATEITRSPVPITALSIKELHQNLSTNIIDAIARLPGVNAVTTGPNVSKPFIHGLGYNRVLTLFDGIRMEGQQWGDEHGIDVDDNSVDRIEIVKGPASLTYGSDALAGVVNLLPASSFHLDTIQGHIDTDYQTNNGLFSTSASLNGNKSGVIWGGVLSHKQATNYQNRIDGRVYGTAFNETDLRVFTGLNKQWGYSHLSFSVYNDLQEIPDGSRDSLTRKFTKQVTEADTVRPIVSDSELNSYKITLLHQHIRHYLLYLSNNFILGKSRLGVTLGYQQNIRQEYSHPQFPGIPGTDLDLKSYTYDIKYTLPEFKGWETTMGINGMFQTNNNRGTEFIIPDYHMFDAGPFILITRTIGKVDLNGGLRYDTRVFRNNPMYIRKNPETGFDIQVNLPDTAQTSQPFFNYKHTFSGLSGSIGATFNITRKLLIKSNISRGFRSPNILEISANGVHSGSLLYQIGNDSFKPEFSLQEDVGISYRSDHISGNLDLFNNNISNYIFNQKLLNHAGQDSVIIKGNQTFKFQQSRAQLFGWEANLDIHPYDWLHFENSISVIYALNRGGNGISLNSSNKYLPLIPPLHTNTDLKASITSKSRHFSSLYIKIGLEYYARQDRIYSAYNTETPTPGYILINAGVGGDVLNKKGRSVLSINILGNNITDVAYQSHLSRLKYFEEYPNNPAGRSGIYNMGRNISFRLTVPLNL